MLGLIDWTSNIHTSTTLHSGLLFHNSYNKLTHSISITSYFNIFNSAALLKPLLFGHLLLQNNQNMSLSSSCAPAFSHYHMSF